MTGDGKSKRRGGGKREKHYRVIDGLLYARVVYRDETGRRKERHYRAESKAEAREIYRRKLEELTGHGERMLEADRMTFRALAEIYERRKLIPAEYTKGRKVSGLRSLAAPRGFLETLKEHFGLKRVRNITHSDVEHYKLERLRVATVRGTERAVASVNRELELLRAVLRFAQRQGWIVHSPFESGAPVISKADEVQRTRILTREEEGRLLAACAGRRAHLRPILITLIDTAMRRGELLSLVWGDVDLAGGTITLRASTTKTQRARQVGMTRRLHAELTALWAETRGGPGDKVFGLDSGFRRSFVGACREAGITDLRIHDLRHTATTRMIDAGLPPMKVMKITGHTQMSTFSRYVNTDSESVQQAAAALDDLYSDQEISSQGVELIN